MEMGIGRVKHFLVNKSRAVNGYIDPHLSPRRPKVTEVCYVDGWPELKDRYSEQEGTSGEASEESGHGGKG